MTLNEMKGIMKGIGQAYPNSFSASQKKEGAVTARWLDHFGHLDVAVVEAGARHLRENYGYPTIESLWKSILTVTGHDPPLHRIKVAVFDATDPKHDSKMVRDIVTALGGQHDIDRNLTTTEIEIMFARYAPEVLREHQLEIMDGRKELSI